MCLAHHLLLLRPATVIEEEALHRVTWLLAAAGLGARVGKALREKPLVRHFVIDFWLVDHGQCVHRLHRRHPVSGETGYAVKRWGRRRGQAQKWARGWREA